jgi:hypothetical protein
MKTRLIVGFGVALLAAVTLCAQNTSRLVAEIPFDFQAGKVMLPAGKYEVDLSKASSTVWLATEDRTASAFVICNSKESLKLNETGKLVFNRYGNHYFLSQVWPYGNTGREIIMSAREKEIASSAGSAKRETLVAKASKR